MAIKFPRKKMDCEDVKSSLAQVLAKGGVFPHVDRMYDARVRTRWIRLLKAHAKKYTWELFHKKTHWLYEARDGMLVGIVDSETWDVKQTSIDTIRLEPGWYAIVRGTLHRIIPNI